MSDIDGAVKLLGGKGSLADERVVILAQSTGGGLELAQALARVFATAGASVHMLGDVADIEVHAQNIATEIEGRCADPPARFPTGSLRMGPLTRAPAATPSH